MKLDPKDQPAGGAPTLLEHPPGQAAASPPAEVVTHAVAVPHHPKVAPPRRRLRAGIVILALAGLGGGIGFYLWQHAQPVVPPGIAFSNGRIEADEIDIDTKFAGRIAELRADIGDRVAAGQVVARMDTRDLQQSLQKAEAQRKLAQRTIEEVKANLEQLKTQQTFAAQELERAQTLVKQGWTTKETFDQRKQALDGANAALVAGEAKIAEAEHALQAAEHDVGLYTVNIDDNDLVAPRDGRIQYRVANVGEVLPAGGKVFTMLDIGYVYMDVYLPTLVAGKIRIGTEARIVLDAYPDLVIPATVSYVASEAQFTPKTVETQNERDKLVFRIRVRIDEARSRQHADAVRSGLPGLAYIRWDPSVAWPARLQAAP